MVKTEGNIRKSWRILFNKYKAVKKEIANKRKEAKKNKQEFNEDAQLPFLPNLEEYVQLTQLYNKFLIEKVYEGHEVVLPSRMGVISIVGTKKPVRFNTEGIPLLPPDWVKTKALWESNEDAKKTRKVVYHTNPHTSGVVYKFFWSKKNILVENKELYSLRMVRKNKRKVNDLVVNSGMEYYVRNK